MDKISNFLLPIAEQLSKNRYLSAIRDGYIAIMPLVITASLFTLINSVLIGEGNYLEQWFGTPFSNFSQLLFPEVPELLFFVSPPAFCFTSPPTTQAPILFT